MKIGIIENEPDQTDLIVDICQAQGVSQDDIISFASLSEFAAWIETNSIDIVIADLRLGSASDDRSGWEVIKRVITRELVPVIIYSAYASENPPDEYTGLMISRVIKGQGNLSDVLKKIKAMKEKLSKERNEIQSVFKMLTLETISKILLRESKLEDLDEDLLAFMARIRLASHLMNFPSEGEKKIPPEAIFIYPPLELVPESKECVFLGDFLTKENDDHSKETWFVISPSCDLVYHPGRPAKVCDILLMRCYTSYSQNASISVGDKKARSNTLKQMTKSNVAKILKCPKGLFGSDYMVLSFKDYKTTSYEEIKQGILEKKWLRVASLASPYAESLQNLFIRDLSRIGTPETTSSSDESEWIENFVA